MTATEVDPQPAAANVPEAALTIRRARLEDSRACFDVTWEATADLAARNGVDWPWSASDVWPAWQGMYRHLAQSSAEWWLAEDGGGRVIGAARSVERDDCFQLTELHVRPSEQSRGVGRALIQRAFPAGRGDQRVIVASNDVRGVARYYATGVAARLPIYFVIGEPAGTSQPKNLTPVSLGPGADDLAAVVEIDRAVLGLTRGTDIEWLLTDREAYLYLDAQSLPVGYAFVGQAGIGPIAAIEPTHIPEMLLHVEDRASAIGVSPVEFVVPGPNLAAMNHLLRRGFRLNPWTGFIMSDRDFGRFDRYVLLDPPYLL